MSKLKYLRMGIFTILIQECFYPEERSSPVYSRLITMQSWPPQNGGPVDVSQQRSKAANRASMYVLCLWP